MIVIAKHDELEQELQLPRSLCEYKHASKQPHLSNAADHVAHKHPVFHASVSYFISPSAPPISSTYQPILLNDMKSHCGEKDKKVCL